MIRQIVQGQRQSGKSHLAVYEFMKDPMNSVLIVANTHAFSEVVKHITDHYKLDNLDLDKIRRRIKGVTDVNKWIVSNKTTVIFDEMLFFPNYETLLDECAGMFRNYYIFSSLHMKGDNRRDAQKKFIKKLRKLGWNRIKITAVDPEAYKAKKKLLKRVYAASDKKGMINAEKAKQLLKDHFARSAARNPIAGGESMQYPAVHTIKFNQPNTTVSMNNHVATTTVTQVDPKTPMTYTQMEIPFPTEKPTQLELPFNG
jgi:hypothetical protein